MKQKKLFLLLTTCLLIIPFFLVGAEASIKVTEIPYFSQVPSEQSRIDRILPTTFGDYTVWMDKRDGGEYEIYSYNSSTKVETKISGHDDEYYMPLNYKTDMKKFVLYGETIKNANETNFDYRQVVLYNLQNNQRTLIVKDGNFIPIAIGGDLVLYGELSGNNLTVKLYAISTGVVTDFPYTSNNFLSITSTDGRYVGIREDIALSQKHNYKLYDLVSNVEIPIVLEKEHRVLMGAPKEMYCPQISGDKVYWYDEENFYIYTISSKKLVTLRNNDIENGYSIENLAVEGDLLVYDKLKLTPPNVSRANFQKNLSFLGVARAYAASSDSSISIFSISGNRLLSQIDLRTNSHAFGDVNLSENKLVFADKNEQGNNSIYLADLSSLNSSSGPTTLPRTGAAVTLILGALISGFGILALLNKIRKYTIHTGK